MGWSKEIRPRHKAYPMMRKILILKAAGMTTEQIAYSLNIARVTVRGYISKATTYFGWDIRQHVLEKAVRDGELTWPVKPEVEDD